MVGGTPYHRYDEGKTLDWLEAQFERLKAVMLENVGKFPERLGKDGIIYSHF